MSLIQLQSSERTDVITSCCLIKPVDMDKRQKVVACVNSRCCTFTEKANPAIIQQFNGSYIVNKTCILILQKNLHTQENFFYFHYMHLALDKHSFWILLLSKCHLVISCTDKIQVAVIVMILLV